SPPSPGFAISCLLPDDEAHLPALVFYLACSAEICRSRFILKILSVDVNWIRDGGWSCLSISASSILSVDTQPALQNDANWKRLLFLLIVARAQNLAGNICPKHRRLPRSVEGRTTSAFRLTAGEIRRWNSAKD